MRTIRIFYFSLIFLVLSYDTSTPRSFPLTHTFIEESVSINRSTSRDEETEECTSRSRKARRNEISSIFRKENSVLLTARVRCPIPSEQGDREGGEEEASGVRLRCISSLRR